MALHEIVVLGDEVLRKPGEKVDAFDEDLERLIEDMFETMYHADGVGLAAPQIGISRRICVIDVREEEEPFGGKVALINPEIVEFSKATDKTSEGCLSIPGLEEVVTRPERVRVRALDPSGEPVEIEVGGLFARALQHEVDHLDGVLFIDRVSPLKRRMLLKKWKKLREEDG